MVCGSIRNDSLVRIYREHLLFVQLRTPTDSPASADVASSATCAAVRGRARTRPTGSPFESDPLCAYQPGQTGG